MKTAARRQGFGFAGGLILLGVPTFYQFVAKGTLLLLAVMIQEHRRRGPRPIY